MARKTLAAAAVAAALTAAPAQAAERIATSGDFTLSGSIGLALLEANEFVYETDDGSTTSQLIWESTGVPVATFEAEWQAGERLVLAGSLSLGLGRDSHMVDYDWLVEGQDWSERSQHPDTELDRYVTVDVSARYDFLKRERGRLGLTGGFSYTNVKWTARGGDFVYSSPGDFRDQVGSFPDGQKGISYEQQLPAIYAGPAAAISFWDMTLSGRAVGGITLEGRDVDDHWNRNLRFEENFDPAPYLGLAARLDVPIGPGADLFLGGRYQRHFLMKGTTTITDSGSGEVEFLDGDAAGASFSALTFDAGLRVRF